MENSLHYISVNHENHLIDAINQLRKRNELCDIILKCGNTAIAAHKLILSVSTPYFKSLVENKFQSNIRELKIDDVNAEAVQIIVEFFYTSAFLVDDVIVWTLLPAACRLQVEEIQNVCCDFLSSQLQLENCLRIHQLAASCLCSGLLKESTEFVKSNFDQIIEEEIFLELPVKEVVTHLKRLNDMGIEDAKILQAVKCWIIHSVDDRQTMGYLLLQEFSNLKEELEKFIPAEYQVPQEEGKNDRTEEIKTTKNDKVAMDTSDVDITIKKEVMSDDDEDQDSSQDNNFTFIRTTTDEQQCRIKRSNSVEEDNERFKEEGFDLNESARQCAEKYLSIQEKGSFQLFSSNVDSSSFHLSPHKSKDDGYRLKYECSWPGCTKKFFSKTGLKFHMNKHKNMYPYNCVKCSKGFNRSCEYEDHMNAHAGNFWKCSICGAILKSQHGRRVHESQHANQEFPCDICGKVFPCKDYLNSHLRAHRNSFECQVCQKVFKRKHHYKEHIKVHEKDGFHCEICDFVTNYSQSLKRHMRNSHDPEKLEYQTCKNCGKTFNRHDFLMKHIEKCTPQGHGLWTQTEDVPSQSTEDVPSQSRTYFNENYMTDSSFSLQPEFPRFVQSDTDAVNNSRSVDVNQTSSQTADVRLTVKQEASPTFKESAI